jgi:hypothetical protein
MDYRRGLRWGRMISASVFADNGVILSAIVGGRSGWL